MDAFTGRTLIASIVFLDIVDYSKVSVAKQLEMKHHLNTAIGSAIGGISQSDRVVLDTGDGAAICLLGDPEDALFAATAINSEIVERAAMVLRTGINLGPVKMVVDLNGQRNVVGDGINVAQRVMSFAEPGEVLISRSYYEVVSRLREDQEFLFRFLGTKKDKHIREHQIYAVGIKGPAVRPLEGPALEIEHEPVGEGLIDDADLRATIIDEELAQTSEAALSRYIGPLARVLVKRAVARSRSVSEFHLAIAEAIPDPADRDTFLGGLGVEAPPAAAEAPAPAPDEPAWRLADDEAGRVSQALAREIGPLAKLLVTKAAKSAKGRRDFYHKLADSIADPDARARFLKAVGAPAD